jgi:hypothetical protein
LKFVLAPQEDQSMKHSRFSEEQIIAILKEQECGASVADLWRKHGVSDASIYNSFIVSFDGKFRAECLNTHGFMSLDDARAKWRLGAETTTRPGHTAPSATSRRYH